VDVLALNINSNNVCSQERSRELGMQSDQRLAGPAEKIETIFVGESGHQNSLESEKQFGTTCGMK
jgi:hypothetical protein